MKLCMCECGEVERRFGFVAERRMKINEMGKSHTDHGITVNSFSHTGWLIGYLRFGAAENVTDTPLSNN